MLSRPASSNMETWPCGDLTPELSNQSIGGEAVNEISKSSNLSPGDKETLDQDGGHLLTEKASQSSSTSKTVQPANEKLINCQMTTKYKSKEEKKKARQARRKANRAKYCKSENNRKPNKTNLSKEKCSIVNQVQSKDKVGTEQAQIKLTNKGTIEDDHRSSINKCRHLAVAVRREDKAPVDKELAKLIRRRLTDFIGEEVKRILATNSSGRVIKFKKSGLVSTVFFLVTPATEEARDWLLSRDFGLLDGTRVVVNKLERKKVKQD